MIRFLRKSFRTRLLLGFLAAALLPLILSSLVINSVFLNRQEMREQAEADEQLAGVIREISRMEDSIVSAGERLSAEPRILAALKRDPLEGGDETAVYGALYEATQDLRRVGLNARRHPFGATRRPPGHEGGQRCQVDGLACRQAVHHHADARAVRLPEDRVPDACPKARTHGAHSPLSSTRPPSAR